MNRKRYIIGIDPGVKTGIAVWDKDARAFHALRTMTFWTALDYVWDVFDADKTRIVIETPTLKMLYRGARTDKEQDQRSRDKIAMNVGSCQREATLLVERFKHLGFEVKETVPTDSKWSIEEFQRLTKVNGTNLSACAGCCNASLWIRVTSYGGEDVTQTCRFV